MARTQTQATKAHTPAAVKAAAAAEPKKAPRVHKAKAGTVEGPKGKNLEEPKEKHEVPEEQKQAERRQAQHDRRQQFAPSEKTTPAVHEPTEEEKKMAAFQEQLKKLAEENGIDLNTVLAPQKQARAPRADKEVQNNITRPAPGTKCRAVWDAADKISHDQNGHPASIAQLKAIKEFKDFSEHTIKTQYARWRSYRGIKGRVDAPTALTN